MTNTKSVNYGNSSYSTITSNLWAESILIPIDVAYLPFPQTVEDFYETFKMVGTETYDNVIRIKKDGYLNITLKALISNASGDVDIQVSKLNNPTTVVRHNIKSMGHAEINFESEVLLGDEIAIAMRAEMPGASFLYVAADSFMAAQEAYIMNLHFIEHNDIGNMFYSLDPNLEALGYAIKLDRERTLLKASYPKLYNKVVGTAFFKSETTTDFTIVDFSQNPYLRAGASTAVVAQNLPESSTVVSANTYDGEFSFRPFGGGTGPLYANHATGCFSAYSKNDDDIISSTSQELGSGYLEDTIGFKFPALPIANTVGNPVYTSDPNVKPKSSQTFLYMYSDRQITGVKK